MSAPLHPRLDPACFAEPAARDARFTVVDVWAECVNLPDGHPEKAQEFFHRQMNEEAAVLGAAPGRPLRAGESQMSREVLRER